MKSSPSFTNKCANGFAIAIINAVNTNINDIINILDCYIKLYILSVFFAPILYAKIETYDI